MGKTLIDRISDGQGINLGLIGVPQALSTTFNGLVYSGEVVVSNKWDRELVAPLTNSCRFRIVVLRDGNEIEWAHIQEKFLAVCVMNTSYEESQSNALVELDSKCGNLYGTTDNGYRRWEIFWPMGSDPDLVNKIFHGEQPGLWFERLAGMLLAFNYPRLPLQLELLKEPITDIDAQILIDELFAPDTTNQTLEEFGPALGLSAATNPSIFDPSSCEVFGLIEKELANENHSVGWENLTRKMILDHGLTNNLANLFILSFVVYKNPPMELILVPGHDLTFNHGEPFSGDRITSEIIPTIDWGHDLNNSFSLLRHEQPITLCGSIPYVSLVIPEAKKFKFIQSGGIDNKIVDEKLAKLKECLPFAIQTMKSLLDVSGVCTSDHLVESLHNLQILAQARNFSDIYYEARRMFGNPIELAKAMNVLESSKNISGYLPELNQMILFLSRSEVNQTNEPLFIQWNRLKGRVSTGQILSKGWSWREAQKDFDDFRRSYLDVYHEHHKGYQVYLRKIIIETDRYQVGLDLLKQLNRINQLENRGYNLDRGLSIVKKNIKICSDRIEGIVPEGDAVCINCELVLDDKFPSIEMKQLYRELEQVLREQVAEVHFLLSNRDLQGIARSGIEKSVMQTLSGDLGTLAETLDDEMISYINELIEGS